MELIYLDEVDSTNSYIKRNPSLWDMDFAAVVARSQTLGRGSHGRAWHSQPGRDLALSVVFPFRFRGLTAPLLSLHAGTSVCRALEPLAGPGIELELKWPNDLLCAGRKLAGILIEPVSVNYTSAMIVGIGVNVNGLNYHPDIMGRAVSLNELTGREHSPLEIANEIITCLSSLPAVDGEVNGREIVRGWLSRSRISGARVSCQAAGIKSGTVDSIAPDGRLRIVFDGTDEPVNYSGGVLFDTCGLTGGFSENERVIA